MRAAFFDVDETVITVKSMFEFLRHWLDDETSYAATMNRVHAMAEGGVHRTEINRFYYRQFTGVPAAEVRAAGADWYQRYRRGPNAFHVATLRALADHRTRGDLVVLVTGSFRPILGPLMADIGADEALCSDPVIDVDGRYTGEVPIPMIGDNKTAAVAARIASLGLDPANCSAYGDHHTDLGMLSLVGDPVAVGSDPVLAAEATTHGWRTLPGTTGPLSAGLLSTVD
ncbi:HAD family hydrolase [Actinokineospora inagensis]|uniref:HAD family hydrolase n=1 Tax=Actinokineospora inagensis TaxID=103730 RepID=UPI000425E7F1|nr:HAD-IB family hydrolase [Actinokineospora inagensis]